MNFKEYFENKDIIREAAVVNMGDFTEVLFAIGLLHYTLKKQVTPEDIMGTVNDIPSIPYENTFNHDNYDVSLQLEGKEGVSNLIGGNFKNLSEDHQIQVKEIINKIAINIPKLRTIHKVDNFITKVKSHPDASKFIIGIKSTGSKTAQEEETKADVTMEILPVDNIQIPSDIKKITYSVKYSKDKTTSKVAETSIFTLILRMGNMFKLPMVQGLDNMRSLPYKVSPQNGSKWLHELFYSNELYKKLSLQENHLFNFIRKFYSPDQLDKDLVIKHFMLEFNNEMIVKEKQQPQFSTILYNFLEKEIFGQDMADVVKIDINGIRDIDVESYNKIRNNFLVDFSTRPTKSKNLIFKFEAVAKDGSSFMLFWIDNHKSGTVQIHIGEELLK